jgi:hypothetical protein
MPLSTFPTDMANAAQAVLAASEKFNAIHSQSGDLMWRLLEDAQNSLRQAKAAALKAMASGALQQTNAEAFMATLGGPVTLADFQAGLVQVELASTAWNDHLENEFLPSLPNVDLIGMAVNNRDGIETRHYNRPAFIPGIRATPLRQSQQLSDLVAAFAAVGA